MLNIGSLRFLGLFAGWLQGLYEIQAPPAASGGHMVFTRSYSLGLRTLTFSTRHALRMVMMLSAANVWLTAQTWHAEHACQQCQCEQ